MKHTAYQGRKLSSLTLGLIIFIAGSAAIIFPHRVKTGVSTVLYPILCMQHVIVHYIQTCFDLHSSSALEHRINELEQENQKLMAQVVENSATNHYMHGIEELLAFKRRYALDRAYCVQILSKMISDQSHTILIDAGSLHGIEVDMIALYNNVLLGRVVQVYPHYSKVVLTSDRGCKVAAYCSATGASGIHEGNNSGTTVLSKVSHLQHVVDNDLVISSGEGLVFPQGFALGRIIYSKQEELFYTITVAPLVDVAQLSYCMIISKEMIAGVV